LRSTNSYHEAVFVYLFHSRPSLKAPEEQAKLGFDPLRGARPWSPASARSIAKVWRGDAADMFAVVLRAFVGFENRPSSKREYVTVFFARARRVRPICVHCPHPRRVDLGWRLWMRTDLRGFSHCGGSLPDIPLNRLYSTRMWFPVNFNLYLDDQTAKNWIERQRSWARHAAG
jgi:hypothetical protein